MVGRRGSARLVGLGCVRKECDRPRALERRGQRALVAGARAPHASGPGLAAGAPATAPSRALLVVGVRDLLRAERAHLAVLALRSPASPARAAVAVSTVCVR